MYSHIETETRLKPNWGSSGEYWTMSDSSIQQCFMSEGRPVGCKTLSAGWIMTVPEVRSPGQFCASSRGKTGGASVIQLLGVKGA